MTAPDPRAAVLAASARSPVGRFGGALTSLAAADLGAHAIRAVLERVGTAMTPEHIFLGNVVQAGGGQNPARVAATRGGVPTTVPGTTLNDVCLASLTGVALATSLIHAGELDSALVGGFESMSRALHGIQVRQAARYGDAATVDLLAHDGLTCSITGQGMGPMSDQENARLGLTREEQDAFAVASHERAAIATKNGALAREIAPLDVLGEDEGIRYDTSAASLARLRPAFTPDGTITAGNASQMSDAGSAGLLTSRQAADQAGLTYAVEVVDSAAVAGPDPSLHVKPAIAARSLLDRHRLTPADIDVWEINEAFAGVVLASTHDLGITLDRVNVHGGAIAIGHPLAASGFRILMALETAMLARDAELGVATMCGGGGQGRAVLLRRV